MVLINHDILRLQIPVHYLLLMQILKQDQCLRCKVLDLLKLDTNLVLLKLKQGYPINRFHHKVDMHRTLESGIQLRKAQCRQVLFPTLLQLAQNIPLIHQMLNLLLLV